jgi:hypothetical protein
MAADKNKTSNVFFGFASYNLYGVDNGRNVLDILRAEPDNLVIAVQEYWLTPAILGLLNNAHPD